MRVIEIGPAARVFVLFRCDSRVLSLCAFVPRAGAPYVWWVFGFSSLFFYPRSLPTHAFSETHNTHTHMRPCCFRFESHRNTLAGLAGANVWSSARAIRVMGLREGVRFFSLPHPRFRQHRNMCAFFMCSLKSKPISVTWAGSEGRPLRGSGATGLGPRTRAQH